jgi:hypothetical protein
VEFREEPLRRAKEQFYLLRFVPTKGLHHFAWEELKPGRMKGRSKSRCITPSKGQLQIRECLWQAGSLSIPE